jgi:hypothetical protein
MRFWDPVTIVVILLSCFIVPYTPSHFDPVALAHTEERTLCFGCGSLRLTFAPFPTPMWTMAENISTGLSPGRVLLTVL